MAPVQKKAAKKDDFQVYTRTAEIWSAMYHDCRLAKKSIELEQYILMDDKAGHRFLKLFTEKAKQGVEVRLMLDSIGSRDLLLSRAFAEFRKSGGIACFYNPIHLGNAFRPSRWLPRSHVKTLLIDRDICYTGSACIWDDMAEWHDLQVRFTGDLTRDVREDFSRLWLDVRRGNGKLPSVRDTHPGDHFSYLVAQWGLRPNRIYQKILREIYKAEKSICIVTPYFLPPWLLSRALYRAVRRGIEVQVMVNEKSDVGIADYVSRSFGPRLLRRGIKIFHYTKTNLHAKYIIIDDRWVTIGSTNMDYLSLLQNREANIFSSDPGLAGQVKADFDACMRHCHRVSNAYYRARPLWQKILGYAGRIMRRVL